MKRSTGSLTSRFGAKPKANIDLKEANTQVQRRFDLAMEAIKTFHSGVAEDVLLTNDNLKPVRDRLLKNAAEFYKRLEGGAFASNGPDVAKGAGAGVLRDGPTSR